MGAAKKDHWVLVVEDEKEIRELLVDDLVDQFSGDLRIVEASDGVQATGKLDNQIFDCIITDLNMPKRNGAQFIEWIRESRLNRHSPVVVVSAFVDSELIEKYPYIHFISKPVNFESFGNAIRSQIKMGRLNNRICVGAFNAAIQASLKYLNDVSKAPAQTESPIVKGFSDPLEGDVLSYISIKGDIGRCDIVLGFSRSLLSQITPEGSNPSDEVLTMAATSKICQTTLHDFHRKNREYNMPRLEKKVLLSSPEEKELFDFLSKCSGLKIPISLGDHKLFLTMIHKK